MCCVPVPRISTPCCVVAGVLFNFFGGMLSRQYLFLLFAGLMVLSTMVFAVVAVRYVTCRDSQSPGIFAPMSWLIQRMHTTHCFIVVTCASVQLS